MKPRHGIIAGIVLVALAIVAYLVFAGGDAPPKLTLGERTVEVEDGSETTEPSAAAPPVEFSNVLGCNIPCLLYTSPSPRDKRQSRMPSSA